MAKKKSYTVSKAESAALIARIFGMKATPTYQERVVLAENAYAYLDDMKINPSGQNFVNLVDIVNILVTLINGTDTKKKTLKAHRCPDALQWLWERGYERITDTINACHDALIDVEERVNRTGSWALDAGTVALCEVCIKWYQELTSVMPRDFLAWAYRQCEGKHKKTKEGHRISHFMLDDAYQVKEQIWGGY